jgi:hypothetical protein
MCVAPACAIPVFSSSTSPSICHCWRSQPFKFFVAAALPATTRNCEEGLPDPLGGFVRHLDALGTAALGFNLRDHAQPTITGFILVGLCF